MTTRYCDIVDVYRWGLPAQALARPDLLVAGVVPSTGMLQLPGHGLVADMPVILRPRAGATILGAPAPALPGGLVAAVQYYAQPLGADMFALSVASGGPPIASFASAGVGVFGIAVDHVPLVNACIESASILVESALVAHRGPVNAPIVRVVTARQATREYVSVYGMGNPNYAKSFGEVESMRVADMKLLEAWRSGVPLPSGSTDATPAFAENGARLVPRLVDAWGDGPI